LPTLPGFVDGAKLTEILSKILLLKNDHKIKDETILSQIRRGK